MKVLLVSMIFLILRTLARPRTQAPLPLATSCSTNPALVQHTKVVVSVNNKHSNSTFTKPNPTSFALVKTKSSSSTKSTTTVKMKTPSSMPRRKYTTVGKSTTRCRKVTKPRPSAVFSRRTTTPSFPSKRKTNNISTTTLRSRKTITPNPTVVTPTLNDSLPKQTDTTSNTTCTRLNMTGTNPNATGNSLNPTGTTPNPTGKTPNPVDTTQKPTCPSLDPTCSTNKPTEEKPTPTGSTPQATATIPKQTGSTPNVSYTTPNMNDTTPKATVTKPNLAGTKPNVSCIAPNATDTTMKPRETTRNVTYISLRPVTPNTTAATSLPPASPRKTTAVFIKVNTMLSLFTEGNVAMAPHASAPGHVSAPPKHSFNWGKITGHPRYWLSKAWPSKRSTKTLSSDHTLEILPSEEENASFGITSFSDTAQQSSSETSQRETISTTSISEKTIQESTQSSRTESTESSKTWPIIIGGGRSQTYETGTTPFCHKPTSKALPLIRLPLTEVARVPLPAEAFPPISVCSGSSPSAYQYTFPSTAEMTTFDVGGEEILYCVDNAEPVVVLDLDENKETYFEPYDEEDEEYWETISDIIGASIVFPFQKTAVSSGQGANQMANAPVQYRTIPMAIVPSLHPLLSAPTVGYETTVYRNIPEQATTWASTHLYKESPESVTYAALSSVEIVPFSTSVLLPQTNVANFILYSPTNIQNHPVTKLETLALNAYSNQSIPLSYVWKATQIVPPIVLPQITVSPQTIANLIPSTNEKVFYTAASNIEITNAFAVTYSYSREPISSMNYNAPVISVATTLLPGERSYNYPYMAPMEKAQVMTTQHQSVPIPSWNYSLQVKQLPHQT